MKWSPATIAHFAAGAGFVRPDLYTAIACAIASSGGLDHYDVPAGPPGCGRYVGLWGVDTDAHPQYPPEALGAPETAARAAYELTRAHDGFGWCPAWRSGADRHYLGLAVRAVGEVPFTEREHNPVGPALYFHHRQNPVLTRGARRGRHV